MTIATSLPDAPAALDDSIHQFLADAVEWRMIGLLLSTPRGEWRKHLAEMAPEVRCERLRAAAAAAQGELDPSLFDTYFGPGGPASPREVSYRPAALSSQHLAELAAHYEAFDYESPYAEALDHVAVEADFVAYLRLKQAFAAMRDNGEQVEATEAAAAHIVAEHLACIAEPLVERLTASGVDYLRLAAEALLERTGRAPAAARLPILEDASSPDPYCCGDGETDEFAVPSV